MCDVAVLTAGLLCLARPLGRRSHAGIHLVQRGGRLLERCGLGLGAAGQILSGGGDLGCTSADLISNIGDARHSAGQVSHHSVECLSQRFIAGREGIRGRVQDLLCQITRCQPIKTRPDITDNARLLPGFCFPDGARGILGLTGLLLKVSPFDGILTKDFHGPRHISRFVSALREGYALRHVPGSKSPHD